MARPRSELDERLHAFCQNVYFQPPTGYKLKYPCIVYDLEKPDISFADNLPYVAYDKYLIKYITRDPDDQVRNQIITLQYCSPEKPYISDNLYHHPFSLKW